ncbi:MAG TPA: alpha/beta fold hydrolase [Solirubrobacteraceae bacterium]|nr:alpha/beta fold hydrolase [Solirubrobacteraceae bacterium]
MNGVESAAAPQTIVLIHGLWMTPLSWEHWIERFEARGHRVLAPAWPGMDVPHEQLFEDTSAIENLGIEEIVDSYDKVIRGLDEPTIIMGHSFGGAFTEILLDRGLGSAGVAIDAAGVRGITRLPFSTLRSSFPVLKSPANRHRAVALTFREFHYSFTNTMNEADATAAFERYAVPGPGRVLFEGAFANFNPRTALQLDFKNEARAPLLLIAGGSDHVVPASVDKAASRRFQRKSAALTEYKEFPDRSHFTIGQEGWEEVADYALDWAVEHASSGAPVAGG